MTTQENHARGTASGRGGSGRRDDLAISRHRVPGKPWVYEMVIANGTCVTGHDPVVGQAEHVVMTVEAYAYVNGPRAAASFTGVTTSLTFAYLIFEGPAPSVSVGLDDDITIHD